MNQQNFSNHLMSVGKAVHDHLDTLLNSNARDIPEPLLLAMRHGLLNGGKRLRPFLLIESAALFGVSQQQAMQTACALECLHSYSLIHDDLPAMDDDDMRRGMPTVHKAFDEATAILAGDALLTFAFELITVEGNHRDPSVRAELATRLAKAAGASGMIGGQMLDIIAETTQLKEEEIRTLQKMKTGALLQYALEAGAILGNAPPKDRNNIIRYGEVIGLAFQLSDDLLDVTSNAKAMGKAVRKDADRGKATIVALFGIDKTQALLKQLSIQAINCLESFDQSADLLRQTAEYISLRKS